MSNQKKFSFPAQHSDYHPKDHVDYEPFWEGLRNKRLVFQKCMDCEKYRHYPRPICPICHSWNFKWCKVSGKGKIWSWTVISHATDPVVANTAPYNIIEVELEEQKGLRITSNIVDCEPEDIYIGMSVEVIFEEINKKLVLPRFKKASG